MEQLGGQPGSRVTSRATSSDDGAGGCEEVPIPGHPNVSALPPGKRVGLRLQLLKIRYPPVPAVPLNATMYLPPPFPHGWARRKSGSPIHSTVVGP